MNFQIKLCAGSDTVETLKSFVHDNNDFRTAAMMATAALFSRQGVDNVTASRISDTGTVADDHFFYGEKG